MEDWAHLLLRTLHYALLLGLFGVTAFPLIGLRQLGPPRAMAGLAGAAMLAPLVTGSLMLVEIAAMMGQPIQDLDWPTIGAIVGSTAIGWSFALRLGLLLVAALFVRGPVRLAAILYGLAVSTLPWNGHAAVGTGAPGMLHRLNDASHLLAAGLWLGAIIWFAVLSRRTDQTDESAVRLLGAMHRFASLGVALVAIVTATGLVNALLILGPGPGFGVIGSDYGWLLALKLALVALMLLCAARHATVARRSVLAGGTAAAERDVALVAVRRSLAAELALALAVIAVVALFGLMSPTP